MTKSIKKFFECEAPHTSFGSPASFIGHLAVAKVFVTWRTIMPRTDLLEQSTTRVELDQRSRDARLRLECVERLLAVYPLPRSSLLRRFFRCLYWRTREGGQIEGPVSLMWTRRQETPRDQQTAGNGGRAGGYPKGSPAALPNCQQYDG